MTDFNKIMKTFKYLDPHDQNAVVEEIVESFTPLIVSLTFKYFGRYDEDVIQDATVELLERVYSYDPSYNVDFLGYINKFMTYFFLRAGYEYYRHSSHNVLSEIAIDNIKTYDSYDIELLSCLKVLSPKEKQVINDNIICDIPLNKVAKSMNISYATIKRIKKRALQKLRRSLGV